MSIIVSGIRLPLCGKEEEAVQHALQLCGLDAHPAAIYRKSLDARHGKITQVFSVCIENVAEEAALVQSCGLAAVRCREMRATAPVFGRKRLSNRPVVIGTGPAGLFAAYTLAKYGYTPLVLERGAEISERDRAVDAFFGGGKLDCETNIQFGEGGAGAYSDGKLTTRINDALCDTVLHTFVQHGAPQEILRLAKPHIGTDILKNVVRDMRERIQKTGGDVRFHTQMTGVRAKNGVLCAVVAQGQEIACERAILAIGHSARDTFATLVKAGVSLQPKAFSVGVRIEHLQAEIDKMMYGTLAGHPALPPAEYALSHRNDARACYSFCMCPGGHVVAAQSENESVVTNGMSYHARDGVNANAALVVSVDPTDFAQGDPLGGIAFQRQIERAAFAQAGGYAAPCQRVGDFMSGKRSADAGAVQPTFSCGVAFGSVAECLPSFVQDGLRDGLRAFGRKLQGFDDAQALLTAPETRTSSPVRILRGENHESTTLAGLMPCGEGAGYAGGIMSAAVDGIRAAYKLMEEFAPLQ